MNGRPGFERLQHGFQVWRRRKVPLSGRRINLCPPCAGPDVKVGATRLCPKQKHTASCGDFAIDYLHTGRDAAEQRFQKKTSPCDRWKVPFRLVGNAQVGVQRVRQEEQPLQKPSPLRTLRRWRKTARPVGKKEHDRGRLEHGRVLAGHQENREQPLRVEPFVGIGLLLVGRPVDSYVVIVLAQFFQDQTHCIIRTVR